MSQKEKEEKHPVYDKSIFREGNRRRKEGERAMLLENVEREKYGEAENHASLPACLLSLPTMPSACCLPCLLCLLSAAFISCYLPTSSMRHTCLWRAHLPVPACMPCLLLHAISLYTYFLTFFCCCTTTLSLSTTLPLLSIPLLPACLACLEEKERGMPVGISMPSLKRGRILRKENVRKEEGMEKEGRGSE